MYVQSQPGGEYALVQAGDTMDMLAGNDSITILLLEVKSSSGAWLRGSEDDTSAPTDADSKAVEDTPEWRASLVVRVYMHI